LVAGEASFAFPQQCDREVNSRGFALLKLGTALG
jgi:hypothetical protein